ncbi:D-alanine--D-alanine ligase [Rubrivirga sp. S365]|uniref:D-alanine--D-alanine ligase family protein n=1 Tax=Rubrivirga sp. S365 TaxID=3076080 RepID=UPI0028C5EA2B|nr:D-alanine--D-alanine ligase [Rubrivirga sp. S365]MDT7856090.1 D-alanine--D-alanine ligase [Rubrivirga sp. S365]
MPARPPRPLRVGLVYDRFGDAPAPPDAPPDWDAEYEPEATVAALEDAVRHLGHEPVRVGNVPALLAAVCRGGAGRGGLGLDAAVNIAESYGSRNREAHAPVLLELAGVPALGSDALALSVSLDKHLTKTVAAAAGVATPPGIVVPGRTPPGGGVEQGGAESMGVLGVADADLGFPVIVKPRYEGTAKGIAPTSRCADRPALRAEVARQRALYGQDLVVEAFVDGPEFTVGVVGTGDDAEALPVLQRATERATGIGLHALDEDPARPFAYDLDGALTPDLEAALQRDALAVHRALECHDFSRADFRLDRAGRPVFIETNPLPTFAPDGTFAILAELAGEPYPAFLAALLARGLRRLGLA